MGERYERELFVGEMSHQEIDGSEFTNGSLLFRAKLHFKMVSMSREEWKKKKL